MNPTAGKPMPSEAAGLVERIEAAEGHPADYRFRLLDLDILRATDPDNPACRYGEQDSSGTYTVWEWTSGGVAYTRGTSFGSLPIPRYTASLDAALTLVPEGCEWSAESSGSAHVWKGGDYYAELSEYGNAATPALALAAAALKARAHPQPETDNGPE